MIEEKKPFVPDYHKGVYLLNYVSQDSQNFVLTQQLLDQVIIFFREILKFHKWRVEDDQQKSIYVERTNIQQAIDITPTQFIADDAPYGLMMRSG